MRAGVAGGVHFVHRTGQHLAVLDQHGTEWPVAALAPDIEARKAFFDRHPELSAEAVRGGGLTNASVDEQTSAGLDALPQDEKSTCNG
ncbi:hypothetical protein [Pseudomonas guariconensis]|uniref:hypothetical protein n=1 Tax=Pseudomonas guariconensis TaxID=1288410 RepID=UPI003AF32E54